MLLKQYFPLLFLFLLTDMSTYQNIALRNDDFTAVWGINTFGYDHSTDKNYVTISAGGNYSNALIPDMHAL